MIANGKCHRYTILFIRATSNKEQLYGKYGGEINSID